MYKHEFEDEAGSSDSDDLPQAVKAVVSSSGSENGAYDHFNGLAPDSPGEGS
eukprot:CAMPEP_0170452778 /NCGR_PEP_ID=MMETSP0123-20130129/1559_1 /TAXON_ID=182087 /ORGANISM="Favella ehrenbergii, Strain Fehren 1" /LENGTH=51 /DNA_ID=CAMNT_0010714889 /DNA_START=1126 /DNA_END=1281 /DNA_ORIENTATION=+